MREVTKPEFFAAIGGPRDIHPDDHDPEVTIWRDQKTREAVGRSTPGWRNVGSAPKKWFLSTAVEAASDEG